MTIIRLIAAILILLGMWAMLTRRNMIKMVIGFSIIDTGVHILIVSMGYVSGGTAPILDGDATSLVAPFVDPVPSALVLTAIVIGLAVTAVMLAYVVRLARTRGSLSVTDYKDLKW